MYTGTNYYVSAIGKTFQRQSSKAQQEGKRRELGALQHWEGKAGVRYADVLNLHAQLLSVDSANANAGANACILLLYVYNIVCAC